MREGNIADSDSWTHEVGEEIYSFVQLPTIEFFIDYIAGNGFDFNIKRQIGVLSLHTKYIAFAKIA